MSTDPTTTEFHYDGFYLPDRLAVLFDAVGDLPITDAEVHSLYWLSGWEPDTVKNLAAVIVRARQAGSPA